MEEEGQGWSQGVEHEGKLFLFDELDKSEAMWK